MLGNMTIMTRYVMKCNWIGKLTILSGVMVGQMTIHRASPSMTAGHHPDTTSTSALMCRDVTVGCYMEDVTWGCYMVDVI